MVIDMDNAIKTLENILDNIGVYLEEFSKELKIKDVILDSLSNISFYLEIEKEFNIAIPDQVYSTDISEYRLDELVEKIIVPLQRDEEPQLI